MHVSDGFSLQSAGRVTIFILRIYLLDSRHYYLYVAKHSYFVGPRARRRAFVELSVPVD